MTTLKAVCNILPKAQSFRILNKYQKILFIQNIFKTLNSQHISKSTFTCGCWHPHPNISCRTLDAKYVTDSILRKARYDYTWCQSRGMAGHSKWQNIRHNKAAQDAQKSRITNRLTSRIRVVIREGGSADPKANLALARLIAEAKSNDISNTKIEEAIKGAISAKECGSVVTLEAKGPSGSWLIIEAFTDKALRIRQELASVMKKNGGNLGDSGFAMHFFEHKGVIEVAVDDGEKVDMDKYLEVAIDAGAEDVTLKTDENNHPYLEFICDPIEMKLVQMSLEKLGLGITSSDTVYIAPNPVTLGEQDLQQLTKLIQKIEENTEVIRVFDNVVVPD